MCGSIFTNVYKYHGAAESCGSDETADQARLSLWLDQACQGVGCVAERDFESDTKVEMANTPSSVAGWSGRQS